MINHLTDTAEHRAIAQGKGRWGDPDFPKIGWEFIGITDMKSLTGRCEACGAPIRYIQHLTHVLEDYVLNAGCVCAGCTLRLRLLLVAMLSNFCVQRLKLNLIDYRYLN